MNKSKLKTENRKNTKLVLLILCCMTVISACGKKEAIQFQSEQNTEKTQTDELEQINVEEQTDWKADNEEIINDYQKEQDNQRENQQQTVCYVHICGAVNQPGVYAMQEGSRIYEVITMAGGFREDACGDYVNQAECISDGSQIYIPTMTEVAEKSVPVKGIEAEGLTEKQGMTSSEDGIVNINTATEAQLCTLPGIGSLKANSIILYREQTGGFHSTEDILKVDGIKNGTYQKIKDRIKV